MKASRIILAAGILAAAVLAYLAWLAYSAGMASPTFGGF